MRKVLLALSAAAGVLAASTGAQAQAIIDQGTIQLGVDTLGQLNIYKGAYPSAGGTTPVGLRDLRTGYESTSPGCLCEGWGVADTTNGYSGYANNSSGTAGLTFVSFVAFGSGQANANSVATSVRTKSTVGNLLITHAFTASASTDLYQALVTIKNTGTTATGDLVYRRTMDWDIEPTPFNEYSTIQGVGGNVSANDNGFCSSDPLSGCGQILASGNFIDSGPTDHGANFDFTFAPLAAGASRSFLIFYGASPTEAAALAALTAVGANVYSFGQNSGDINGGNGSTFIFAFRGVGGSTVPEPASWALMIAGFGLVGAAMRRKALAVA
jgi:type IV pilus assembly protein PilY1